MVHLLSLVFQIVRRNLFLFIFIVLALVTGKVIRSEWVQVESIVKELPALRAADADVSKHQTVLAHAVTERVRRLSAATVQQLDAEIAVLDSEIDLLQGQQNGVSLTSGALKGADGIAEQLRQKAVRGVAIELRRQAKAHLIAARMQIAARSDRQAALARLAQLRQAHAQAYAAVLSKERELAQVEAAAGLMGKIPFTMWHRQVEQRKKEAGALKAANARAHQAYQAQQAALDGLSLPTALAAFRIDRQRLAEIASPLHERLVQAEGLAAKNHLWQAYQAVRPVLPTALAVLIGWWLAPPALRALFYFVLAPHAARMAPIVICMRKDRAPAPAPARSRRDGTRISAVSQTMNLLAGHEMLIRPDYCQSQSAGLQITTKLLFSWRRWLTSIAAHLWMLKRLQTTQSADIVVSSTADPLDEVAVLEIAAGEAVVLQPRGLVGIHYKTGQRPNIRSHWRLGTLHAWLTLQLRYLAFEGPATLIVKGCRGVRLESASSGRTVSQDATLGFSANAIYSTVRADPFLPYLRGKQSLFHDKFTGQNAYYFYEEVPRNAHPGGQKRNPLEALLDASLKAFGI